jgi:catechol 2,3-dioxygenase-like lactoylglutathione lyase family enzyme
MPHRVHYHLNVTATNEHRRFFEQALGGTAVRVGSAADAIVEFPNALVFLHERPPTGGTKGTTVNHFAFGVPEIRTMVNRVKTAGFPMVTRSEVSSGQAVEDDLAYLSDQATFVAFTMAPDDTKVEFIEIPAQATPVAAHHIHFAAPRVPDMQAWYIEVFDAKPRKRGNFETADLPCVNLTYSPAPGPVAGTLGRALDRIGFEIADLDGFCRRLEALGISSTRSNVWIGTSATVLVTDPWGTAIELTQPLEPVS